MAAMEEYILMAVPEESPAGDTLRLINDKTSGISTNYVLPLPDVKVGCVRGRVGKRLKRWLALNRLAVWIC